MYRKNERKMIDWNSFGCGNEVATKMRRDRSDRWNEHKTAMLEIFRKCSFKGKIHLLHWPQRNFNVCRYMCIGLNAFMLLHFTHVRTYSIAQKELSGIESCSVFWICCVCRLFVVIDGRYLFIIYYYLFACTLVSVANQLNFMQLGSPLYSCSYILGKFFKLIFVSLRFFLFFVCCWNFCVRNWVRNKNIRTAFFFMANLKS